MTCPRCHAEFDTSGGSCPECGVRLIRNVSGVMKTSAILIAAAGRQGFYRSVQEVPEPLRTRLLETTTSSNSGTIVIADSAGKQRISQAMARRDTGGSVQGNSTLNFAGTSSIVAPIVAPEPSPITRIWRPWMAWAATILALAFFLVFSLAWQFYWQ